METRGIPGKRIFGWQTALAAALLVSMVGRVALLLFPLCEERWEFVFNLACVALVGPVFGMTDMLKQPGARMLLVTFFWMLAVSVLHFFDYRDPELLMPYLLTACVSMFLFYPAAFVLAPARGRRLFRVLAAAYIFCIAAMAAVTLYAAFSGVILRSPGGPEAVFAGMNDAYGRLTMFCNPIEASLYCAIALLLVALLWQGAQKAAPRALLSIAAAVLLCALAVMDARTPSWALCVCVGGLAYLLADTRLPVKKAPLRVCLSLAAALVAAALFFLTLRLLTALLNPLIPNHFDLRAPDEKLSTFTGRTEIWKAAVVMLRNNPSVLIAGAGPMRGISLVQSCFTFDDTIFAHPHSIVLHIVITYGVVGLLLFAAFAGYVLFHAARLFFLGGSRCTFSERALPLMPVFCLIVDLIETFLSFSGAGDHSNPWFFFTAGYIVSLSVSRLPGAGGSTASPALYGGD